MFSLSLARQFLVCFGNRQTFKDLSHQIIQTTSLEQDLPQQKSTDNNSQWFPLFPCLCAFSCRRRLSGMYAWPSCIGTAVRECYDVKEAEKCEEVVISSPSLWNSWSGLFLEHESVFFLFLIRISFLLLCVCSVIPYRAHSSEVTFFSWLCLGLTCVRAGPPCSFQKADLSVMTVVFKVLDSGSLFRQNNMMTPYIFSKHIAGEIRGLNNKWESKCQSNKKWIQ